MERDSSQRKNEEVNGVDVPKITLFIFLLRLILLKLNTHGVRYMNELAKVMLSVFLLWRKENSKMIYINLLKDELMK